MSVEGGSRFSRPDGDVILRTCDMVDFQVHKVILSEASPIFQTLFSLPQPQHAQNNDGRLPEVPVQEDSQTFDYLLRLCYPIKDPVITSIDEIEKVLAAAQKYEVEVAMIYCLRLLQERTATDPWSVYGVAVRRGLEERARAAALESLHHDFPLQAKIPASFERMSGTAVFYLVQYRDACKQAAMSEVETRALSRLAPPRMGTMAYDCTLCMSRHPGTSRHRAFKLEVSKYRDRLLTVVQRAPTGAMILNDAELNSLSMIDMSSLDSACPLCASSALCVLKLMHIHLAEKIDEAISNVSRLSSQHIATYIDTRQCRFASLLICDADDSRHGIKVLFNRILLP